MEAVGAETCNGPAQPGIGLMSRFGSPALGFQSDAVEARGLGPEAIRIKPGLDPEAYRAVPAPELGRAY